MMNETNKKAPGKRYAGSFFICFTPAIALRYYQGFCRNLSHKLAPLLSDASGVSEY
jgi:hypothetical protein